MDTKDTAINWDICLKLSNGKSDLAKMILKLYINQLTQAKDNIITSRNDLDKLQYYIHKLAGASCYCGVPKIKAMTMAIETAFKTQQTKNIDKFMDQLLTNIDEVIEVYNSEAYL